MQLDRLGAVAVGGIAGASIRWLLLELAGQSDFPVATLAANLVACFVLGILVARGNRSLLSFGLATGFCGGLSTMSTLAVETATFLDDGRYALFVVYLAVSLAGGLVALQVGRQWR